MLLSLIPIMRSRRASPSERRQCGAAEFDTSGYLPGTRTLRTSGNPDTHFITKPAGVKAAKRVKAGVAGLMYGLNHILTETRDWRIQASRTHLSPAAGGNRYSDTRCIGWHSPPATGNEGADWARL